MTAEPEPTADTDPDHPSEPELSPEPADGQDHGRLQGDAAVEEDEFGDGI